MFPFPIDQAWLNVAGLALDFLGVLLLAWEWWLALSADQREAELEARERQLQPSPMMPRPANPHQAVFDHMREQQTSGARSRRLAATRGMRRGWFVLAMGLIAGGFLLQMLGSWPGCCAWIGVSSPSR